MTGAGGEDDRSLSDFYGVLRHARAAQDPGTIRATDTGHRTRNSAANCVVDVHRRDDWGRSRGTCGPRAADKMAGFASGADVDGRYSLLHGGAQAVARAIRAPAAARARGFAACLTSGGRLPPR